jgi:peptidyl-dipeptidase Dcp
VESRRARRSERYPRHRFPPGPAAAQKAKLLGFPNYAAWKLDDQMAKTPEAALKFMDALVPGATARANAEGGDIQALINSQNAGFKLEPWDWNFYAEQVRKAKYDMDEAQIKPYFELSNVLENGVFYAASQLYGITFKERKDIPVYNPDCARIRSLRRQRPAPGSFLRRLLQAR